jgi:hypothetical protein
MAKTKTYQIVTVTPVTVDFEECKERMMDAIENYLWEDCDLDSFDYDSAKIEPICVDILKEIAKNLLTN